MRKNFIIFFYLLKTASANSQNEFKTLVPNLPVVVGESFQVQYVIGESDKIGNFKAPAFTHFRFVSGPNQYNGSATTANGIKPIRNIVYTLEAINPGRFAIKGAFATVNGKTIRSNDVVLEVISKEKAAKIFDRNTSSTNSEYVIRPGEDPYEKIRQNLFLKLSVDRTTCFAGEPVLAIFKLYSRLESRSDIVKNPGLYGFTVFDMANLSDKQMNTEVVNGKTFDVHTIRKVQLYPLQEGTFTIDAMEIKNKVEFSHSTVNKKTEQEIVEGMLGNENQESRNDNTEIIETSMHTDPVIIRVKPVPDKNKPAAFNGAVGNFSIAAVLKDKLAKNESGFLEITISGSGNFTQLNAPIFNWPAGIEGFEPSVIDSLEKNIIPLSGIRTFRYAFISSQPGKYEITPVQFSFFDPGRNNYKTVSTTATTVEISNEEKKNVINTASEKRKESIANKNARASRTAVGIVILLVIIVVSYWLLKKDKPNPVPSQELIASTSPDKGLLLIRDQIHVSDPEFCRALQQFIWKYLGQRLNLEGSMANKEIFFARLKNENIRDEILVSLQKILSDCEMRIFTGAEVEIDKNRMLNESKDVLEVINHALL